jgi:hypothetical protein
MSDRLNLDVPGCVNLRDLGGYTTRRGEVLAAGRLFRGAEPPVAPDSTAGLVRATGLRRIVDLRMDEEVEHAGAPVFPDGCEWVRLPLFYRVQLHWPHPVDRTPPATAERYFEMAEAGMQTIARVVGLLGDVRSRPTLIHCVAGRDRTGIVVACVLDLLDVPEDTIAAWESARYYIVERQSYAHSTSTGGFAFPDYEEVEFRGWKRFAASFTRDLPPQGTPGFAEAESQALDLYSTYLHGHVMLIFWRVIERLIAEGDLHGLKLASPFRLGFNFHDQGLITVVRIINWPAAA